MGLDKCRCLVRDKKAIFQIKKGKYDLTDRVGVVRLGLRRTANFVIPSDVVSVPFGRYCLFYVDVDNWMAISLGKMTALSEKDILDIKTKLELLSRNKFWRFLGGRAMDWVELLITMGAGYGFFRLVEILITRMFGGG